jgi:hypothetical protein
MHPLITLMMMILTALATWLMIDASRRWNQGRGLLRRPDVVALENEERMWQARTHRRQGWRQIFRAIAFWLLVVALVALGSFLMGGVLG